MPSQGDILIADDEEAFRESLGDILKAKGYRVCYAEDGLAAAEWAKTWRYRLVILDIRMPRKDGVEALLELVRLQPSMPVVMVTAFRLEEGKRRLVAEHAVALYTKPLDVEAFLGMVVRYCPPPQRGV